MKQYAGLLLLALFWIAGCSNLENETQKALQSLLQAEEGPYRDDLQRFYTSRGNQPVWVRPERPIKAVDTLAARLCAADREGLRPGDYYLDDIERALQETYGDASEAGLARAGKLASLEITLSNAFMAYADHLAHGRVLPGAVGGRWLRVPPRDLIPLLGEALGPSGVGKTLDRLAAQYKGRATLRDALVRYRQIQTSGGWPAVPAGDSLKKGDTGARVVALRHRLAATGNLRGSASDSTFDDAVAEAVRQFRSRHGLKLDSVVDAAMLAALNVPVEERIRQLELNLERRRWMPESLGGDYVLVRIPAFHLYAYRGGKQVLEMPVIAGPCMKRIPLLADTITYVVFNPYWDVPPGIAESEILPQARKNSHYLVEHGFQIVDRYGPEARVYDPDSTDLSRVASGELLLRQVPGPENVLGRIKMGFPNPFDIYLHGAPVDSLSGAPVDSLSGSTPGLRYDCIRVERPVDLAAYLLQPDPTRSRNQIEQALQRDQRQRVDLARPIPIYIVYLTAWVNDSGTVHFRDDIYGHDAALWQALGGQAPEQAGAACVALQQLLKELT